MEGRLPPPPRRASVVPPTEEPPRCVVVAVPTILEGKAPLKLEMTSEGACTDGPASFAWDFGDGTPVVAEQNPTHVFEKPGEYTAKVTIRDPNGRTDSDAVVVTVTP